MIDIDLFSHLLNYQTTDEFKITEQAQRTKENKYRKPYNQKATAKYRRLHPDLVNMRSSAAKFRQTLLDQQSGLCFICGAQLDHTVQIDHIKPLIKGGTNDLDNLCVVHRSCNIKKGSK